MAHSDASDPRPCTAHGKNEKNDLARDVLFHLFTDSVRQSCPELPGTTKALLHVLHGVLCKHSSLNGLFVLENVRKMVLQKLTGAVYISYQLFAEVCIQEVTAGDLEVRRVWPRWGTGWWSIFYRPSTHPLWWGHTPAEVHQCCWPHVCCKLASHWGQDKEATARLYGLFFLPPAVLLQCSRRPLLLQSSCVPALRQWSNSEGMYGLLTKVYSEKTKPPGLATLVITLQQSSLLACIPECWAEVAVKYFLVIKWCISSHAPSSLQYCQELMSYNGNWTSV